MGAVMHALSNQNSVARPSHADVDLYRPRFGIAERHAWLVIRILFALPLAF